MKKQKITLDAATLRRMQPPVPQAHRQATLDAIHRLANHEEEPMKRKSITAVILCAALILAMAGAALAIAGNWGVLDFLIKDRPVTDTLKETVQTEFTEATADLGDVTVRVRDAISDGLTLSVAVEYRAKNPDDAVLTDYDSIEWQNDEILAFYRETHRGTTPMPDFDAVADARAIHTVSTQPETRVNTAIGNSRADVMGNSWTYEGTDTLVAHMMYDISQLGDPHTELTLHITPRLLQRMDLAGEDIPENATPTYAAWDRQTSADMTLTITPGAMETHTGQAQAAFPYTDFRVDSLSVTTSPLATYVTIAKTLTADPDAREAAFIVCDADGNPYRDLVHSQLMNQPAPGPHGWDGVPVTWYYQNQGDTPAQVILRAMPFGENDNLPPDLVVELTPVP